MMFGQTENKNVTVCSYFWKLL